MAGANYMGGKRNAARAREKDITGKLQRNHFGKQRFEILRTCLSRSQTQSRAVKSGHVGASGIELAHARRDLESNTGCGPVHEIGPVTPPRQYLQVDTRTGCSGSSGTTRSRASSKYRSRILHVLDATDPLFLRSNVNRILQLPDLLGLPKKHKLSETDWSYNEDSTLSSKTAQSPNKRHRFSPSPKLVGGSSVPSRQFECRTPLRQQQIDRGHNSGEAMHTPHNLLPSFHEKLINSRPALLVPQPDLDFEPMIFDTSPGNDTYRITETVDLDGCNEEYLQFSYQPRQPFYDGLGLLRSGIQAVSPSDRHLSSPNIEDSMGYSSLGTDSTRGSNILSTSPYSVFSGHSSLGVASTHPDSEASCWEGVVGDSDEGKCLTIGPADRSYTTPNTSLRRNKALHFAPGFLSDISVYSTDSEPLPSETLAIQTPSATSSTSECHDSLDVHVPTLTEDLCPLVETADTIEQPLIEALQGQLFEGADPWRAIDKLLDLEATSQLCTDASEDAASSTHRCQSVGSAFLAMNGRSGVGHAAARADASEEELHLIYTNLTRVYEDNAQKDLSLEVILDATHAEAQRYSLPKAYGSLQDDLIPDCDNSQHPSNGALFQTPTVADEVGPTIYSQYIASEPTVNVQMNQELIHHSDVSGVVSEDTSINVGFDGHIEIAAPCTYVHSSLVNAVDSKESVEMSGAADSDMHSDTPETMDTKLGGADTNPDAAMTDDHFDGPCLFSDSPQWEE